MLIAFEQKITEKQLDVAVDFPEHAVYTRANQDAITQVVYNLVDNAVKFCPQEGTLTLSVREGGGKLYVSVGNEGEEIPPQELPLVFDRPVTRMERLLPDGTWEEVSFRMDGDVCRLNLTAQVFDPVILTVE